MMREFLRKGFRFHERNFPPAHDWGGLQSARALKEDYFLYIPLFFWWQLLIIASIVYEGDSVMVYLKIIGFIRFIFFPFFWVIDNVCRYVFICALISDDSFVIIALPDRFG